MAMKFSREPTELMSDHVAVELDDAELLNVGTQTVAAVNWITAAA